MIPRCLLLGVLLVIAACGESPDSTPAANTLIQGELTESTYRDALAGVLPQAQAAISDPSLSEATLDRNLASVETLLGLTKKLNVDRASLGEAELMSAIGALYTRKAGMHADNPRQAGAWATAGFRYLDRAVAKYPNNFRARINRGLVRANLPNFGNRPELAEEDLRFAMQCPEFARLTPKFQRYVESVLHSVETRTAAEKLHD